MKISRASDGFIMLETMLATIVIAGIVAVAVYKWGEHQFEVKAESAGTDIARIIQAVDAYVAQNADIIGNIQDSAKVSALIADGTYPAWKAGVPRIGADPNPCSSSPDPCVRVPLQKLVDAGFLTQSDSTTNAWGFGYDLIIKKTGIGQGAQLDALLANVGVLDRPERTGSGVPDSAAIGAAVTAGGTNVGAVREVVASDIATVNGSTLSVGALAAFGRADKQNSNLGWVEKSTYWPNITTDGQLVARAGYKASAWASFLRLSGGTMTGDINMGGNSVKNAKSLSFSNAGIAYGSICADMSGAALADDNSTSAAPSAQTAGAPAWPSPLNAYANKNRFGAGAQAQWTPPAGSASGPQVLQCIRFADGTYKWGKPSASQLTWSEVQAGMMDGWVSEPIHLCGVGGVPTASRLSTMLGNQDQRVIARWKIKRRTGQTNSASFMQVWTGPLDGNGNLMASAYDPNNSLWVDLDSPALGGINAYSYFGQNDGGWYPLYPAEPNKGNQWYMPDTYSIPGVGQTCISGVNNVWYPAAPSRELGVFASNQTGDARGFGVYNGLAGVVVTARGVNLRWANTTTVPVVTDSLAGQGRQQLSNATVTGANCTYQLDPITGISTLVQCDPNAGSVIDPRVSRGFVTTSGVVDRTLNWFMLENP